MVPWQMPGKERRYHESTLDDHCCAFRDVPVGCQQAENSQEVKAAMSGSNENIRVATFAVDASGVLSRIL
jgi:hypothetical protein